MRRYNLHRKCADIAGYMPDLTVICDYDDFGFDPLVLIDAYLKCGEDYYEGE